MPWSNKSLSIPTNVSPLVKVSILPSFMPRYCGKTIFINWKKPKNAICLLLTRNCTQRAKSSTVSVSRPPFQNLPNNLSVIFGYCSQNWRRRAANKLFNCLSILVSVPVLISCYCVSSAVMPNIRFQSRPMAWASGGKPIKP